MSVTVTVTDRLVGVWWVAMGVTDGFTSPAYLVRWDQVTGCVVYVNRCVVFRSFLCGCVHYCLVVFVVVT